MENPNNKNDNIVTKYLRVMNSLLELKNSFKDKIVSLFKTNTPNVYCMHMREERN